jgi:DNA-binding GntR family transcriptional regulator
MSEPVLLGSPVRLQRSTTTDDVVRVLRDHIVSGQLAPGTQLREVALAAELGVSRPTLREALRSLQRDGLVRHRANRGVFVASLDTAEVEDLYRVRLVLETAAARRCAEASDAALAALQAAFDAMVASLDGDDLQEIVDRDLRFHQAIVGLLESPRLDSAFHAACDGLRFCLSLVPSHWPEVMGTAGARVEHEAILTALQAGDAAEAERQVAAHIEPNRVRVLTILVQRAAEEVQP